MLARPIAAQMQKTIGQPVVLEYRPGAGGTIAYQLFKGPGFTDVWGNTGTDAATGIGTGFGASHDQEFTVSARATLIGTETATSYTDTITATVTY